MDTNESGPFHGFGAAFEHEKNETARARFEKKTRGKLKVNSLQSKYIKHAVKDYQWESANNAFPNQNLMKACRSVE